MTVTYCTIASANYLPRVRVLADSLSTHQTGAELQVLLCEWPERCRELSAQTGFQFLSPADICPDWRQMAFTYDVIEFNTALKPFLLAHLLQRKRGAVFYFDPDIEIFGSLDALEDLAKRYALILTPHICKTLAMDGLRPGIDDIIKAGQFNLGFIGVKSDAEVERALHWWQEICIDHCTVDHDKGYFVDQFWAAALPSFVQDFHCLRAPEYNAAYWNIFQRPLERQADVWLCDKRPLKFFHFSGLPSDDLTQVSRHQNRVSAMPESALYALLGEYADKIQRNVWCRFGEQAYSFACFSSGREITLLERRRFLALPRSQRRLISDPFADEHRGAAAIPPRRSTARLIRSLAARMGDFADVTEESGLHSALAQTARYLLRGISRRQHD